ncbi:MAG: DUF1592 domain-containing protein [Verrucomicrobiota bacterium]
MQSTAKGTKGRVIFALAIASLLPAQAADPATKFEGQIKPLIDQYCSDCHEDGMKKGNVSFDEFKSTSELVHDHDLWTRVLRNVRMGLMPPVKRKERPTQEEIDKLVNWVKYDAFQLNPASPDPGRVTIRRLNRVEYQNTIRDLMGVEFRANDEFPPDDSGYGFDNIGDVLTVSPLLLEKYLQAAEKIVTEAVPTVSKVIPVDNISGREFKGEGGQRGEGISFYKPAKVSHSIKIDHAGKYKVIADFTVRGSFDFDPGRCHIVFKLNDEEKVSQELGWDDNKKYHFEWEQDWQPGEYTAVLDLKPLKEPAPDSKTFVNFNISSVKVQGPEDKKFWKKTNNYDRFFTRDEPPASPEEREKYARELLSRFAQKAFRRPVDSRTVDKLVAIAEEIYKTSGKTFEEGVSQAMVAVLASPRFLFRNEKSIDATASTSLVDEYSLASRLSYFLWSTMPDEELLQLAEKGQLRNNLKTQIKRMVEDSRSRELVENFTGQWLEVGDVAGFAINERAVFAREDKPEENNKEQPGQGERRRRRRNFQPPRAELDGDLRRAMERETEMYFSYIMKEDRSVLEMIDSDYTFLNQRLAKHYDIPGVEGNQMRKVTLPEGSPRGGILTQGSVLVVTSNPTRTSPVKRGVFVLDNFLGAPPAPPPPDLPTLEESRKEFKDREPSLREMLAVHRAKPLCASCHDRMDPLGLALDNFNALGMWRDQEHGDKIDSTGTLITGEPFKDIRELKSILVKRHAADFYRCLTEKMLTYALGRGLEYYDVETVDQIVARLEKSNGKFSELLLGVIESAPFQKRRNVPTTTAMVDKPSPLTSAKP